MSSAIWAAGYQPTATATKTVKPGLAKPEVCLEGYKMYGGQTHQPKSKVRLYESLVIVLRRSQPLLVIALKL